MNTSATFAKTLKRDLKKVITDRDVTMANTQLKAVMKVESMEDAYEDYQRYGGLGKADNIAEGQNITIGTVTEGAAFRFVARKTGIRMTLTDEAMEDCKYKEAIKGARYCVTSTAQNCDYDVGLFFDRAFNSSYVFGDGVPLCSASHPLAVGGTFSNIFATPMAPSIAAVSQARSQARGFVGDNGLLDPRKITAIIAPKEQETDWEVILNSKLETSSNNFSRINVAQRMGLKVHINDYITASTTNYWFKTDAEDGLMFKIRRRIRSRTWAENANETFNYATTMRYAIGHANGRCVIGVGS